MTLFPAVVADTVNHIQKGPDFVLLYVALPCDIYMSSLTRGPPMVYSPGFEVITSLMDTSLCGWSTSAVTNIQKGPGKNA
jgi:hypothetical protein